MSLRLIMTNCSGDEARKLLKHYCKLCRTFILNGPGKVFDIDLSMALVPISPEKSVSEILGTADVSLSAAKDGGRGRIHEYRPHDSTVIRRHDEMHWVLQTRRCTAFRSFPIAFSTYHAIAR